MAGRPRLPAQTKKAKGTYRPSRENKDEAQFSPLDKMPACPKNSGTHYKRLWEYAAELVTAGVITKPDIISFEILCERYERYKTAEEYIAKDPLKNVKGEHGGRSAQAQQMNADLNACIKLMNEFGLTPASRNRFGVSKKKETDPDTEKMKELLGAQNNMPADFNSHRI